MTNKWVIIGMLGVVVLFVGINLSSNEKGDIVIFFPIDKDFQNPDQGTATFNFRFPETDFKVGDELADSLMFLDSKMIPGLIISYNQKEKRIYAGIPLLITEEVTLLDGEDHKIEYTFNRNRKQQTISLDGNVLASGEFTGELNLLTGYVSYKPIRLVESTTSIDVSFE